MARRYLFLAGMLGLVACAASGPEPAERSPAGEPAASASEEHQRDGGTIEVAKIPDVPVSAAAERPSGRICSNEKRTGSNRVTRVCRSRAEIEQEERDGRKTFEKLHRTQEDYR